MGLWFSWNCDTFLLTKAFCSGLVWPCLLHYLHLYRYLCQESSSDYKLQGQEYQPSLFLFCKRRQYSNCRQRSTFTVSRVTGPFASPFFSPIPFLPSLSSFVVASVLGGQFSLTPWSSAIWLAYILSSALDCSLITHPVEGDKIARRRFGLRARKNAP